MYTKKPLVTLAFFSALLLLLLALPVVFTPRIHDLRLSAESGTPTPIRNYYREVSYPGVENYHISGLMDYHPYQSSVVHITPDDCLRALTVNDVPVPLGELSQEDLCDFHYGFDIDLRSWLKEGENTLRMEVWDSSPAVNTLSSAAQGYFSIYIYSLWPPALCLAFIAAFCAALVFGWRKAGIDGKSIAVLLAAVLLCLWHIADSGYTQYAYDLPEHMDYIRYVIDHFLPPNPHDGKEFYHPPLYYYLAAAAAYPGMFWQYGNYLLNLRILSLVCFTGFLSFGARALRKAIRPDSVYYLTLLLLAFWPNGSIIAGRINNDLLWYFFFSAAFYYVVCWLEEPLPKFLARALLLGGMAVAAKTNGILIVPAIALAALYALWKGALALKALGKKELLIPLACALALCAANFGVNFARAAYYHDEAHMELIEGIRLNSDDLIIRNDPYYFLSFDYTQFLGSAFFNVWDDRSDRAYFWNTLLKSSLYGEFRWREPTSAVSLNFLLLLMALYAFVTTAFLFFSRSAFPKGLAFHCIVLGLMVSALAALRLRYPYACHGDFRHIYPALIPFLVIYGLILDWHSRRSAESRRLYWLGILPGLAFACISFSFIILQH